MSREFPLRPEEFEKGWVEEVFGAPTGSLAALRHEPVGTGQVCDSFRFHCDWSDGDLPATFVAKCPSANEISRQAAAIFHLYDAETGWYRDVAAQTGVSCPNPYYAAIGENEQEFALLLQDMAPAEQGDQLAGASLAQVRSTLNEAATLHSWRPENGSLEDYGWLLHGEGNSGYVRSTVPTNYPRFRERFTNLLSADVLDLGQELADRFEAYMSSDPRGLCITHNDMRLDNILFDNGGDTAILVDWQTVQLGVAAGDVAYMIGTSFADPTKRAREERGLIEAYLARRAALGQPDDYDTFWEEYRRAAFAGFIMAINAALHVEQTERGDAMFAAMAERPAQMAIDLDSLASI